LISNTSGPCLGQDVFDAPKTWWGHETTEGPEIIRPISLPFIYLILTHE